MFHPWIVNAPEKDLQQFKEMQTILSSYQGSMEPHLKELYLILAKGAPQIMMWMMYPKLYEVRESTRDWIAQLIATQNAGGAVDAEAGEVIKEELPSDPFGLVNWIFRDYREWNLLEQEEKQMYADAAFFKFEDNKLVASLYKSCAGVLCCIPSSSAQSRSG